MQVLTNAAFVKTRGRLGRLATVLGFGCLIGGLALSWGGNPGLIVYAYATLLPGYVLILFGSYNTLRWGVKPRVDEALSTSLKTLDNKYQLFNYVRTLPVDNLLLTPTGLFVIEARPFIGEFSNVGGKWRRKRGVLGWLLIFGEGGLGNPTKDAKRGVAAVRQFLTERLGQDVAGSVPVDPVVVFTHPRAVLTVEDSEVPAVAARDLKPIVRRPQGQGRLTSDVYRGIAKLARGAES